MSTSDVNPDVPKCVDSKKKKRKKGIFAHPVLLEAHHVFTKVPLNSGVFPCSECSVLERQQIPPMQNKDIYCRTSLKSASVQNFFLIEKLKAPQDSHVTPVLDD